MASALSDEVAARVLGEVHSLAMLLDRQRGQLEKSAAISQAAAEAMVQNTHKVLLAAEAQARAFYRNSNDAKVGAQVEALKHCAEAVTDACAGVKKDMRSLPNDAAIAARQAVEEGKSKAIAVMQEQAVRALQSAAAAQKIRALTTIVGISLVAIVVAVVVVGATAYRLGKDAGQAQGFAQAREESAAASWGNSADGKLAFRLAQADPNNLTKLALCQGTGWKKKGSDVCIPTPDAETRATTGWRISK